MPAQLGALTSMAISPASANARHLDDLIGTVSTLLSLMSPDPGGRIVTNSVTGLNPPNLPCHFILPTFLLAAAPSSRERTDRHAVGCKERASNPNLVPRPRHRLPSAGPPNNSSRNIG